MILLVDVGNMVHTDYGATEKADGGRFAADIGLARVRAFCEQYSPLMVYGCLDNECTWRRDLLPSYKADREPKPQELINQINEFKRKFDWPLREADDNEADDVIATICHRQKNVKIVIMSRDKDMRQLLEKDRVVLLRKFNKSTGLGEQRRVAEWCSYDSLAKPLAQNGWGITPNQCVDFQAVCGDSTDGVPGAAGIGEKTIVPLLQEFGTIENILAEAKLTDKRRESLQELATRLDAVRGVLTLNRHCDLREGQAETHKWQLQLKHDGMHGHYLECGCGRCGNRFFGRIRSSKGPDDEDAMVKRIEAQIRAIGFYDPDSIKHDHVDVADEDIPSGGAGEPDPTDDEGLLWQYDPN